MEKTKHPAHYNDIDLLPRAEQELRLRRLRRLMAGASAEALLVHDSANIYYLTGRVFCGFIYIESAPDSAPLYFVRRPCHLAGPGREMIRKPEDIPAVLFVEEGSLSYTLATRIRHAFEGCGLSEGIADGSGILRACRAVKTEYEQAKLRESGVRQTEVYSRIPSLYREGMSDIELQIEIERESRLAGCLGQFRISGDDMELYMGNVLTGANADTPSPYDFAMGGAGLDPSLPVGADGTVIRPGIPVMVDVNGNYTGYMTDMTRCYVVPDEAAPLPGVVDRAHRLSVDICHELARMGRPGTKASDLYMRALGMAEAAGMIDYFMGHRSHAGFVGHGCGIEINELPVISPRSRDVLEAGNVIAIEPKFVLPGIGAVGIENTYLVTPEGMKALTSAPEEIIHLR